MIYGTIIKLDINASKLSYDIYFTLILRYNTKFKFKFKSLFK
jgi:hypothetical protein